MFEHYLPNKNERATVASKSKFLQLQQQCAVRNVRVERVRRPGEVPGVGRHPSHGSRLPFHRGWVAQGHLLQPRHPALREFAMHAGGRGGDRRCMTVSVLYCI